MKGLVVTVLEIESEGRQKKYHQGLVPVLVLVP